LLGQALLSGRANGIRFCLPSRLSVFARENLGLLVFLCEEIPHAKPQRHQGVKEKMKMGWVGMEQENRIAKDLVDAAYKVHNDTGPGLLESVYEVILAHELERRGHDVARQVPIDICYEDLEITDAFRADLVVDDLVIVELKSVEQLQPVHKKQLLTYLRLTNRRLGFVINFGAPLIKEGLNRVINSSGSL
jgi:GxxExxY protein